MRAGETKIPNTLPNAALNKAVVYLYAKYKQKTIRVYYKSHKSHNIFIYLLHHFHLHFES
jgi:hypothetical protein